MKLSFVSHAPTETEAFGRQLAKLLQAGHTLCLEGDLGAGKTLLVQAMAEEWGIADQVSSPTFALVNVYDSTWPIYHFDLYRLEHPAELYDIGFYEYTEGDGLAIIEWPNQFPDALPAEHLYVTLQRGQEDEERIIELQPHGKCYEALCEELKQQCPFLA